MFLQGPIFRTAILFSVSRSASLAGSQQPVWPQEFALFQESVSAAPPFRSEAAR
jgi:hypothetical protein